MSRQENPAELLSAEEFFHGTPRKAAAKGIVLEGLRPGQHEELTALTPIKDAVYVTKSLTYAAIYALGGAYVGYRVPARFLEEYGNYGYVFVIPGEQVRLVDPDEDSIGEMVYNREPVWLRRRAEEVLSDYETMFPEDYDDDSGYQLLDLVDDGLYGAWAEAGRVLVAYLSEEEILDLIDAGAHVAHYGALYPSEAWRIDRRRSEELEEDASNFFEVAEIFYEAGAS